MMQTSLQTETALYQLKRPKVFPSKPLISHQPKEEKRKISPLPLLRTKLTYSSTSQAKLLVSGHKYISSFVASGENTTAILKRAHRSKCLKMIGDFEFDPYFCRESALETLQRVLKKLKTMKKLHLIVRRVNFPNETDRLCPLLPRLMRLQELKLEFPRTEDVDKQGWKNIISATEKCRSVKFLDYKFVEIQESSLTQTFNLDEIKRRHTQLHELGWVLLIPKNITKNEIDNSRPKLTREIKLKNLVLGYGITSGWFPMSSEGNSSNKFEKLFGCINLKSLTMKSYRCPLDSFFFESMVKVCEHFTNLESLNFEMINCRISDVEAIVFALGLSKSRLKNFTLKVFQSPNLSEECIAQITMLLCRVPTLQTFQTYYRKLNFPEESLQQISIKLSERCGVDCCYSKQSLSISK